MLSNNMLIAIRAFIMIDEVLNNFCRLRLWNLLCKLSYSLVRFAQFSPDSKYVVTASRDGISKIVEVLTGKEVAKIQHLPEVHPFREVF